MTLDRNNQPPRETDPAKLAKLLEIELMQKRASWQQAKARRGTLRAMSFLFLFVVIIAAVAAFYFLASSERVPSAGDGARPAASP